MSDEPKDIIAELRRPFPAEAIRVKLQTATLAILYIDARLVIDRLNHVCGLDWHDEYKSLEKGQALCKLTVGGVTREDVGIAGEGVDGTSPKAVLSDALKRAAVKFGVGISIYATPRVRVGDNDVWMKGNGKPGGLKDHAIARIRNEYAEWLKGPGVAFGAPLETGFTADSAEGDVEAAPEVAVVPAVLVQNAATAAGIKPDVLVEMLAFAQDRKKLARKPLAEVTQAEAAAIVQVFDGLLEHPEPAREAFRAWRESTKGNAPAPAPQAASVPSEAPDGEAAALAAAARAASAPSGSKANPEQLGKIATLEAELRALMPAEFDLTARVDSWHAGVARTDYTTEQAAVSINRLEATLLQMKETPNG